MNDLTDEERAAAEAIIEALKPFGADVQEKILFRVEEHFAFEPESVAA